MQFFGNYMNYWATPFAGLGGILFFILVVWSIVWKGMALWKAARAGHKGWFIALLVINTLGILEILYLYVFSKPGSETSADVSERRQ